MWDIPFDPSMLHEKNVIIFCPHEALATELMQILEKNGVLWRGSGEKPTSDSMWSSFRSDTCYWIESMRLTFGDVGHAERCAADECANHIFCYYDAVSDFDTATEEDFKMLFS